MVYVCVCYIIIPTEAGLGRGNLRPVMKPSPVLLEEKPETLEIRNSWEVTSGTTSHTVVESLPTMPATPSYN